MDLKEIRQLIKLLADTDIAEIEVREEVQTVRITRQIGFKGDIPVFSAPQPMVTQVTNTHPVATTPGETTVAHAPANQGEPTTTTITIPSPMVGTYYHAASPDALPFISRGDFIKKGQVVCIIEAMKLMNEIEAEHTGQVVSILKDNASPVEYGEPLFIIEPV